METRSQQLPEQVGDQVNLLAFELYRQFSEPANLMFSPLGLYYVLGALFEGARGETRAVLSRLLHHDPELSIAPRLGMLMQELNSRTQLTEEELQSLDHSREARAKLVERGEWDEWAARKYGTATADDLRLTLSIANKLWIQESYPCRAQFLEAVQTQMAGDVGYLRFDAEPAQACKAINDWINEKTGGRIGPMLSPIELPPLCRMICANALYFKARWSDEFGTSRPGPFYLLDGTTVQARMMTREFWGLDYMQGDGFWTAKLPYYRRYYQDTLSMVLVVPAQSGPKAFESLEREFPRHWERFRSSHPQRRQSVTLTMPEFKITAKHRLSDHLSEVGGAPIFGPDADFSEMSDEKGLYVGKILQDTYIAVDRYGTEASAATLADVIRGLPPKERIVLIADRPFLFGIVDEPTGVLLFVGRVTNPVE